jgi:hypothetical protein
VQRKDKEEMSSFEQLQNLIGEDLRALRLLKRRGWFVWPMERMVKEEHLGRCCYLAEEMLNAIDLCALKLSVGLDEEQWRSYKIKISR